MPYAEIKGHTCERVVLRGFWRGNQQGCPDEGSPQRPHGWGDGPSLGTVYSYGRPWAHKDVKSESYSPSWYKKIDNSQWEDYGNAQGADRVIIQYTGTVNRPKNPTKVTSVSGTYTGQSKFVATGDTITVAASNPNLYDCSTWMDYPDPAKYQYYGYRESRHSSQTETKTVLAQSGSTAVQNFAFDMEED